MVVTFQGPEIYKSVYFNTCKFKKREKIPFGQFFVLGKNNFLERIGTYIFSTRGLVGGSEIANSNGSNLT